MEKRNKNRKIRKLKKQKEESLKKINFDYEIFPVTWKAIDDRNNKITNKISFDTKKKHTKKFKDLENSNKFSALNDETEIEFMESVYDMSKEKIDEQTKKILAKGLKFGCKAKKVDTYEILANFEVVCQQLNNLTISDNNGNLSDDLKIDSKQVFFQKVQKQAV